MSTTDVFSKEEQIEKQLVGLEYTVKLILGVRNILFNYGIAHAVMYLSNQTGESYLDSYMKIKKWSNTVSKLSKKQLKDL